MQMRYNPVAKKDKVHFSGVFATSVLVFLQPNDCYNVIINRRLIIVKKRK